MEILLYSILTLVTLYVTIVVVAIYNRKTETKRNRERSRTTTGEHVISHSRIVDASQSKNNDLDFLSGPIRGELVEAINIERECWVKEQCEFLLSKSSVADLVYQIPINELGYSKLLGCFEWQYKRLRILIRDGYTCRDCKQKMSSLHVHHTYYLKDHFPWEIENEALVALCRDCHTERHKKSTIPVYKKVGQHHIPTENTPVVCRRCNGAGHLPQFNHVENGICFECNGDCIEATIFSYRLNRVRYNVTYSINNLVDEAINFIEGVDVAKYRDKVRTSDAKVTKSTRFIADANYDDLPF